MNTRIAMNTETEQAIAEAVRAEIATTPAYRFELVYVDYRDGLEQEQVDAIARGDWEALDASMEKWVNDAQFEGACQLLEELVGYVEDEDDGWDRSVLEDWLHTDSAAEIRFEIQERDTSAPLEDLAAHSGNVLLRVTAIDEDDAWSFEPIEPTELLARLELPATEGNLSLASSIIDNTSPEYGVAMGYWLFAVNVRDLIPLMSYEGKLRITGAHFWLGNPFAGSGWADGPFEGEVVIDRADLRTDKDAFGYSWTEVVGGTSPSYYESKIEVVS
jgi:hypothetical protein